MDRDEYRKKTSAIGPPLRGGGFASRVRRLMSDSCFTRYDMHVQRVKAVTGDELFERWKVKDAALRVELPVRHSTAASWAVEVAHACLSHATFSWWQRSQEP